MNENAREFLVMIPVPYLGAAATALGATVIAQDSNRLIALGSLGGFTYKLATNARLTWTTKFAVFRTDGAMSALIRQSEEALKMSAQAEDRRKSSTMTGICTALPRAATSGMATGRKPAS